MAKRRLAVQEGAKRLTMGQLRIVNDILTDLDSSGRTLVEMLLRSIAMHQDTPPEPSEELQGDDRTQEYLEAITHAHESIKTAEPDSPELTTNDLLADLMTEVRELKANTTDKRTAKTLGDMRDEWLKVKAKKKSLRDDKQRLGRFLQFLGNGGKPLVPTATEEQIRKAEEAGARFQLHDITADHCQTFLDSLAIAQLSQGTINRHIALLKSVFTHADKKEWKHQNPMRAVSLGTEKARTRTATPEEYQALIANASPGLRLAIILAMETGMRRSEICNITKDHIHLEEEDPFILLEADMTKGEEARVVPLNKACIKALKERPGLVGMRPDSITAAFTELCDQLNIKDLHFHDMRATFATNMLRRGVNTIVVSRLTGHKTLDILNKKYARLNNKDLVDAVQRLDHPGAKPAKKAKKKGS